MDEDIYNGSQLVFRSEKLRSPASETYNNSERLLPLIQASFPNITLLRLKNVMLLAKRACEDQKAAAQASTKVAPMPRSSKSSQELLCLIA